MCCNGIFNTCTLKLDVGSALPFHKPQVIVIHLGIDFASDGRWDTHVKRVISNGRKKVDQLHSIARNINQKYEFKYLYTFAS